MSADVSTVQVAMAPTTAQGTRTTRWGALSGVVFGVALVGDIAFTLNSPSTSSSASKIQHYYLTHHHQQGAGALLTIVAVVAGLSFFVYLRAYYRTRISSVLLPDLFLVGGLVFGMSGAIGAGLGFAASDHPQLQSPSSLVLLNTLNSNVAWGALCIGLTMLYFTLGLIIRQGGIAPRWLSWGCFLFSLLALTFFIGFVGFVAAPIWAIVVGIRMARSNPAIG